MIQAWGGLVKLLVLKGNTTYLQESTRVYPDVMLMMCHHHMGTTTAVAQDGNKIPGDSEVLYFQALPPSKLLEKLLAALPLDTVSWVVSTCCNSWIQVLSCRSLNAKLCKQSSKTIANNFQKNSDVQERPS